VPRAHLPFLLPAGGSVVHAELTLDGDDDGRPSLEQDEVVARDPGPIRAF